MKKPLNLRLLGYGATAGVLLSLMRGPLGLDWTQLPATSGSTQALFRAAALIAIAIFLSANRPAFRARFSGAWLLFATSLGFAFHGFFLATLVQPGGRLQYGLVLVLLTVLLRMCAGPARAEASGRATGLEEIVALAPGIRYPERCGLFLAGAGVAIALEGLAHEVRLFGLGLPEDDSLHATVFLVLTLLGALAFGPFLQRTRIERPAFAYGLPLVAASALSGIWFLAARDREGLFLYLRRMDIFVEYARNLDRALPGKLGIESIPTLDGTAIGTWWIGGLLAAAAWVLPAFVLGATVGGTRHPGRVANALLGGAAGLLIRPWLIGALSDPLGYGQLQDTPWAWKMIVAGTVFAAGGSAIAIALTESGRAQKLAPLFTLGAVALPWIQPRLAIWSFSPWYTVDIEPDLVVPSSAGMLTVEKMRGGVAVVTLDRKRITPALHDMGNDWRRLEYSLALLDRRAKETPRVLFIGQLTPQRSRFFREAGVQLERTAAWHQAFGPIEEELFAGHPEPFGEVLSPVEARARLAGGYFDLVIAAPVHGPVLLPKGASWLPWGSVEEPLLRALSLPEGTLGVCWVDAASPLTRRKLGQSVMFAMERFDDLSIGIVYGAVPELVRDLVLFEPGPAGERVGALALLNTLPRQRLYNLQAALMERIARANDGTPNGGLARGLALHYAAQEESSPYEKRSQQIELSEDALRAYLNALPLLAPDQELDRFSRELWESVAWLLTEKRRPDLALAFLEPLTERWSPWPQLDRAVGHAHRELLDPGTALEFLERAANQVAWDVNLWRECAAAAGELGDDRLVVKYLRMGLSIQAGRLDLELPLALALMRQNQNEGRELLERLGREHPDHEEIARYLVEGPPPGGPRPFSPSDGHAGH
jgi:tetratricopeptide (TPR) repeat protein